MLEKLNEKMARLDYIDIKLIKWSVIAFTIILVKFFPQLLKIDYWILIVLTIAFAARPGYKFWAKK